MRGLQQLNAAHRPRISGSDFLYERSGAGSVRTRSYTLETENIPKIGKVLNRTTGDKTPFHCEVYFINKAEQMAIKWGTDSKVQYVDPTYGFPISIGASGEMSLRAENSRKLLVKLVGTENYLGQQQLIGFFRAFLMTRVKTYIAQVIKANAINIFEIDENLTHSPRIYINCLFRILPITVLL